ncbi:uncharacterized protein LOC144919560 [Branchiostoma floridae x Branchiostoma belcheri]
MSDCSIHRVSEEIGLLVNLTHLDLSRNWIEYLPGEICNMTSLKWLCLHDNELSRLPERIGNLLLLEYLDVSVNKLHSIPNSFKLLICMNKLELFYCGCYQLDFLSELKQLTELTVDFWQLVSIQQQTAEQLPHLAQMKVIYFDRKMCLDIACDFEEDDAVKSVRITLDKLQCGIIELQGQQNFFIPSPPSDFNYSGNNIKMDLSGSSFDKPTLKIGFIHTLQELTVVNCDLDLTSNEIDLPANLTKLDVSGNHGHLRCIGQQNALQKLKMSNCGIQCVPEDIGMLVNLTHLDLSRNWIEDLPDEICNMASLKWLCLHDNELSRLPERIGNLLSLEYLDVSFNKLVSIPNSFRQLRTINELRLSQCGCCHLAFLNEFREIKILQVDFWQLLSIPQHTLMQFPGLVKISMNSSKSADCAATVDLEGLKQGQLNLHHLNIISFSTPSQSIIHGLGRSIVDHGYNIQVPPAVNLASSSQAQVSTYIRDIVKYLDLSHNKLRQIPEALSLLGNLTYLHISNNIITALPRSLFSFQKRSLQHLDLSHNKLDRIPEALSLLGNLTYLDISNNIITALPRSLLALKEIGSFYVHRNKIVWGSFIDLAVYKKLKHVKFDLINYPFLDRLPSSLISVTVTLCDGYRTHIVDIDWDIQTSKKPHKYFDFVVRCLQGRAPDEVMLSSSDMYTISPIVFSLPVPDGSERVHSLLLSSNNMPEVPSDIFQLLNLQNLDLSKNNISLIPGDLWKLPNLSYLNVSYNKIKKITEEISFAKRLTTLLAQDNELTELPQSISTLPLLEELSVFSNDINISKTPSVLSMMTLKHLMVDLANAVKCESHLRCSESLLMHCYYQAECVFAISAKIFFEHLTQRSMLLQGNDKQLSINLAGFGLVEFPGLIISQHLNVEAIDLAQNEIKSIPPETSKLQHLQKIILSQNGIKDFPQYLHLCKSLKHLDLSLNAIESLPDDIEELKGLKYLNLSSNSLKHLPLSIGNLQQLEEFVLEHNQIDHLPDSIEKLQKLSILRLSQNGIQYFPQNLHLCKSLKHLDLYLNAIESLPDDIGELKGLRYLNLSSNSLKHLPLSIGNLQQLEEFVLEYNQIDQLPDSIGILEKLSILRLSANCLRAVPCSLCTLVCLKQIDLSNNGLESIPEKIGTLRNLTSLDISGNSLPMLTPSICSCHSLETMKLSSNTLTQLPDSIDQLENLIMLQASMNGLSVIPSSICRLQRLQTLDVSVNNITELPRELGELSSLTALNVGNNHLKELPESFTKLVNVTSVDISSNDLKAIPEEMFEFVKLIEFNISGNKIDTLPNTLCELQNLEYLSLEENNIRVLPIQFGNLHKLHHFGKEQIQGNPIEQPPIEVFEQGLEGVVAYFEELKLSKPIEVPRVKALLLGEVAAGKTSLCNAIRLGESKLTDIADRTAGIEVHPAQLQDSIQVLMHDFGGHKIYHLTHQFFFSKVALYLIVVDLEAFIPSSFDAAVKYWLNVIKARIDSKPVLRIVATHIDMCDSGEIKQKAALIMKKTKQIEIFEVESLKRHLSEIDDALNKAGSQTLPTPNSSNIMV